MFCEDERSVTSPVVSLTVRDRSTWLTIVANLDLAWKVPCVEILNYVSGDAEMAKCFALCIPFFSLR